VGIGKEEKQRDAANQLIFMILYHVYRGLERWNPS
jgi:hypothetical protein